MTYKEKKEALEVSIGGGKRETQTALLLQRRRKLELEVLELDRDLEILEICYISPVSQRELPIDESEDDCGIFETCDECGEPQCPWCGNHEKDSYSCDGDNGYTAKFPSEDTTDYSDEL